MKTRRNMLLGISGCVGMFSFPVAAKKVEKAAKVDLVEKFREIQEIGRQMMSNRMEIYKLKGKSTNEASELREVRSELADMIGDQLETDVIGTYLYVGEDYVFWAGNIGPALIHFNFTKHVNEKLNRKET